MSHPSEDIAGHCGNSYLWAWASDDSGTITYEKFQNVFKENVGTEAIPFDFDWYVPCALARALNSAFGSDWVKLYLGTKNGQHVLGCEGAFTSPDNDLNCSC